MSTALSTIISDIKLQDADVVRAQLLVRIKIPAGLWVLHACDRPRCCNPLHLRLGTPKMNMADCVARGRHRNGRRRRTRSWRRY